MATRVYLSNIESTYLDGTSWSRDAGWAGQITVMSRCLGVLTKGAGGQISQTGQWAVGSGTAGTKTLVRTWFLPPMEKQTISGTFKGQIMAREYAGTDNVDQVWVSIRVWNADLNTVRGTLVAHGHYGTTGEFINNATHRNKIIANGDSLTSINVEQGDRIVIELGVSNSTAGTSPEAGFKVGADGALSDLAENETQTTDGNPWIEFSGNIAWAKNVINTQEAYAATALNSTTLTAGMTVGSGLTNTLLLAFVNQRVDAGQTLTSVTWNGTAMTELDSLLFTGPSRSERMSIRYIKNPTPGTGNFVCTGSAAGDWGMVWMLLDNVEQVNTFLTAVEKTDVDSPTTTISRTVLQAAHNSLVLAWTCVQGGTATPDDFALVDDHLTRGTASVIDGANATNNDVDWATFPDPSVTFGYNSLPGSTGLMAFGIKATDYLQPLNVRKPHGVHRAGLRHPAQYS